MMRFARLPGFQFPPAMVLLAALTLATTGLGQDVTPENTQQDARRGDRERREREELDQRNRRLLEQHSAHVKEISGELGKLAGRLSTHRTNMENLLTSDEGKRLAQDGPAALTFLRMYDQPLVTVEKIRAKKAIVDSIVEALTTELKRPSVGYLPSDEQKREVDEVLFWTNDYSSRLSEEEGWLTTTLDRLPKDADLKDAKTLQVCIRDYKARWLQMWADARLAADEQTRTERKQILVDAEKLAQMERAELERDRRLAEERATNERERAKLKAELVRKEEEIKQIELDAKQKAADIELKYEEAMAKLERTKKEAAATQHAEDVESQLKAKRVISEADKKLLFEKCDDPEVKRLLAPFLEDAYWQPGRGGNTVDKGPVSLSRLRAYGALQRTPEGLQRLLDCGTSKERWAAQRPRWAYHPKYQFLKPADLEELKKAQEYLTDLGETLVERKRLAP